MTEVRQVQWEDELYSYEPWDPDVHGPLADRWVQEHGLGDSFGDRAFYPSTGFLVEGCVLGFVYITNSPVAIIDSWVSDPNSDRETRRKAISVLFELLMRAAREHECRIAWFTTSYVSVTELSRNHGFMQHPSPFSYSYRSL